MKPKKNSTMVNVDLFLNREEKPSIGNVKEDF
jgi:hypothetical protein